MPAFPIKLDASATRAAFPFIVGPVLGAEVLAPATAIVFQGRGAFAAIHEGDYLGCCPTRQQALARIDRAIDEACSDALDAILKGEY